MVLAFKFSLISKRKLFKMKDRKLIVAMVILGVLAVVLGFNSALVNANKPGNKAIVVEFTNPLNSVVSVDTFYVDADIDGTSFGEQFPMWIVLSTCPDNASFSGEADMGVKNLADLLEHECSTPDSLQHEIGLKYGQIIATWIEE